MIIASELTVTGIQDQRKLIDVSVEQRVFNLRCFNLTLASYKATQNVTSKYSAYKFGYVDHNGIISGKTYETDASTPIESKVVATLHGVEVASVVTTDGKYNFSFLDSHGKYDIVAEPIGNAYQAKIQKGVVPVVDVSSYKFVVWSNYTKIVNKKYEFNIMAADYIDNLQYNLDNAADNISINQNGKVTVEYVVGDYEFVVNVTDTILGITKTLDIKISVI